MVDDPVLGHRSFHAHSAVACVGLFARIVRVECAAFSKEKVTYGREFF
jgi:hypothetical protein